MSIAVKTFRAALWKAGGTWLQVAIDLLGVIVIARVLGPESYGVMGAALLVVGLMRLIFEGALVECLVQRDLLAPGHIDATFWSCLLAAMAAAVMTFSFADTLAGWTGVPAAAPYLQTIAWLLPFSGAAATPRMLQERGLQFREQSQANVVISIVSNLTGVVAALMGAGIWSLVGMEAVRVLGPHCFVWSTIDWRPGLRCRAKHFRELAQFNALVIGTYLIGHLDQMLPRAMIANFLGATAMGYYLIALRLFDELTRLVTGPLAGICMSIIARLQRDRAAMQRIVLGLYQAATLTAMPVFMGTIAVAPLAVPWLFGSAWTPAVTAVQILMLSALRTSTAVFNVSILRGAGRADLPIALLGFGLVLNLLLIPSLAGFGLAGVMIAVVLRQFGSWPLGCLFIRQVTGLPIAAQLRVGVAPALAALLMLIVVSLFVAQLPPTLSVPIALSAAVLLGTVVYGLSLYALDSKTVHRVAAIARAALLRDERLLAASLGEPALDGR